MRSAEFIVKKKKLRRTSACLRHRHHAVGRTRCGQSPTARLLSATGSPRGRPRKRDVRKGNHARAFERSSVTTGFRISVRFRRPSASGAGCRLHEPRRHIIIIVIRVITLQWTTDSNGDCGNARGRGASCPENRVESLATSVRTVRVDNATCTYVNSSCTPV